MRQFSKVLLIGLTSLIGNWSMDRVAAAACTPDSVGFPADSMNATRQADFGQAIGQTFYARAVALTGLTVWRPAGNRSVAGAHLFITAVDTTFAPPRPNTNQILLNGPTITIYDSNPPGQVIPMHFVLDPPLSLPRPGYYAWFLQAADCFQGQAWFIGANSNNIYKDGFDWITGRASTSCFLPDVTGFEDQYDLLYELEFCSSEVPTVPMTWGKVKLLYR